MRSTALAIDNIISADVVIADGRLWTTSKVLQKYSRQKDDVKQITPRLSFYSMRTILMPFVAIAALLTLSATATAAQLSPEDQLAAAEAEWMANKPQTYEYTFKQTCVCPPALPGSSGEPLVFRVENGVGSLMRSRAVSRQARQHVDKYSTMESLFTFIRAELAQRHYRMQIEYDPKLGYPRRVYIKSFQNAADDEYSFRIEDFKTLASQ